MEPAAESTKGPATDADHTAAAPVLAGHPTLERIYSVGYVYHPQMMLHENVNGHPEEPARISQIYNLLVRNHCIVQMKEIPCREATSDEILLVHSEDLWEKVQALSGLTTQEIEQSEAYYDQQSLYVCPSTPLAARLSCGGVIEAALAVARGKVKKSFAIVRPPGHHSEPLEPMGFCFFNNVAVATRVVQYTTSSKRIMILDWDVHHGNGTQLAFNDDPSVLYISLHRYEQGQFYPCGPFGRLDSCGEGPGLGKSVNIPWPEKGMGDADYLHAFQKVVMPIGMEFGPDLVIISAGFDAADGDDLGECHVTPEGYAHMTHMLCSLAGGRVVVALEGGYDLPALSNSALAVAKVLLGDAPPQLKPMVASESGTETVWQVCQEQSKYWDSLTPKAVEPREHVESKTFSISELLKAHRQDYLYREFRMMQVPLLPGSMDDRFGAQAMCTSNFMDAETAVFFVHEFGEIHAELQALTCNVQLENSYLIDTSKDIITWVTDQKYGLLDVNVLPISNTWMPSDEELSSELVTYLWDNYVALSEAKRVVLIGQGSGCQTLLHLLSSRTRTVTKSVISVIQIIGHSKIPKVPKYSEELQSWYYERSQVYVPAGHRVFLLNPKTPKRVGAIVQLENGGSAALVKAALPYIRKQVEKDAEVRPAVVNSSRRSKS